MLDESNHVPVEAVTPANDGEPVLDALKALMADDAKAQAIGKAGQHLAIEVLHPDNVDRQDLHRQPYVQKHYDTRTKIVKLDIAVIQFPLLLKHVNSL